LDIQWSFDPALAFGGVVITAAIVTVIGVLASFDVLFRRPLATLRSQ